MALHPDFPNSPHAILNPDVRWFPADEALRESSYEKLLPPLVHELRKKIKAWRDNGYEGAAGTSIALLNWWFNQEHMLPKAGGTMEKFQYYFAQQEAVESIIYLYDAVKVKDKYDLLRFDSSGAVTDYRSVVGYFTRVIMKDLRLVSGYDVLYGKVKYFIRDELFEKPVDLDSLNTLRNLSELEAGKTLVETFKKQINALTVQDRGDAKIRDTIKLRKTRPFVVKEQGYIIPKKSIFNKIIGDSRLELQFAAFLEDCDDIISYVKNYMAVHFKIDYVNAKGDISNYYPDFVVKKSEQEVFVIETKGLEDLDVPLKMERLKQWCVDINKAQSEIKYDYVFVDEESFNQYQPKSFNELIAGFREYKGT